MNQPVPGPDGANGDRPSPARLYDHYLGGKNNYPVDREASEELLSQVPELLSMARANRYWLRRVVGYMARSGVDQFLDIGSGLPAQSPTHEVAQQINPSARVVYVDNDPLAATHARALVADDPDTTAVVQADLRNPEDILTDPSTERLIDFSQPVGLLLVAILHFLQDRDRPYDIARALRSELAPGSYVAISHVDNETAPERAAVLEQVYEHSAAPGRTRSHAEIAGFLDGLNVVEPGLCFVGDWRPELGDTYWPPEQAWVYGGLGRVPTQSPHPHLAPAKDHGETNPPNIQPDGSQWQGGLVDAQEDAPTGAPLQRKQGTTLGVRSHPHREEEP